MAPVFLLSGIGAMLGVMTSRLTRVIDRARILEARLEGAPPAAIIALQAELGVLARRARLVGRAITLCTTTALLVCTVIAVLFLSAFVRFDTSIPIAALFIAAMTTFFFGLLWFLERFFSRPQVDISVDNTNRVIGHDGCGSVASWPTNPATMPDYPISDDAVPSVRRNTVRLSEYASLALMYSACANPSSLAICQI